MDRFKTSLETLTLPFRFIGPGLLALLFYCYTGDQTKLHSDIADIKSSQEKIWEAIDSDSKINVNRFGYIYQQCCTGAKVAPPQ